MTVLTFSSLFVAAIVVVGAVYFTLRHVGLQEADDPSESRPARFDRVRTTTRPSR